MLCVFCVILSPESCLGDTVLILAAEITKAQWAQGYAARRQSWLLNQLIVDFWKSQSLSCFLSSFWFCGFPATPSHSVYTSSPQTVLHCPLSIVKLNKEKQCAEIARSQNWSCILQKSHILFTYRMRAVWMTSSLHFQDHHQQQQ